MDEGTSPRNQAYLRSSIDLGNQVEWDSTIRFADRLRLNGVPSYWQLDMRLGWRVREGLLLELMGQNLLDNQQPEYIPSATQPRGGEVERGVFARVTWEL